MEVDFVSLLEWKSLGSPGYVLLRAGLVTAEETGPYRVEATETLRSLFADLKADDVPSVLATLQTYVVAYAYDECGFLSGSNLNMDAVNALRALRITEPGLGRLRSLINKAAAETAREIERDKTAYR